ncbi:MAG: hypothetical protein M3527_04995 [Actinomycetota bacterium]|nr:hypothetical protein [Acidimicrobiia bacterium]MDQ3293792.1 hypothetical protein [Actinomycetota bacterium]
MQRTTLLPLLGLTGLLAACGGSSTDASSTTSSSATVVVEPVIDPGDGGDYGPVIDPAEFVDVIDNPYLPLTAGSRWVYEGDDGNGLERIEVVVTGDRRQVMGVSTWIVQDTVTVDGVVVEDTFDYFAQDREGNVWYFGEDSREFEDGVAVNAEGSWEGGIDGALPGIAMPADPRVGDSYRQEFDPGNAEDLGEILDVGVSRATATADHTDVVVTEDWSPLAPEIVEEKWYARGVGNVRSTHTAGETGTVELVEFTPGV